MALRINPERIRPGYILRPRGKNNKALYYLRSFARNFCSNRYLDRRKEQLLTGWDRRQDASQILERVNYYNKLEDLDSDSRLPLCVSDIRNTGSVYNRDAFEVLRFFDGSLRLQTVFGDNTSVPEIPSICKSRPIFGDNAKAVLLNLDKVRHFTFLRDKVAFEEKRDMAIFRGACLQQNRIAFMERFHGNPLVDAADTQFGNTRPEWHAPLITLYDHLKYKFVLCLEGYDVASNLKWVMSSRSVAVMPRPRYETWFMEGRLVAGVHYIEIASDFSDLEEKIRYFSVHADEAKTISNNANKWCAQFLDKDRELLIALLVMQKYFRVTGQQGW